MRPRVIFAADNSRRRDGNCQRARVRVIRYANRKRWQRFGATWLGRYEYVNVGFVNLFVRFFANLFGRPTGEPAAVPNLNSASLELSADEPAGSMRELTLESSPLFPMAVVYMYKHDRYYKIGRTKNPTKRNQQIKLQLPFQAEFVHQIYTDDEVWLEQFWHQRFAFKRRNGEWFELSDEDVSEFRLAKAMKRPSGNQLTIQPLLDQQQNDDAKIQELERANEALVKQAASLNTANQALRTEVRQLEAEIKELRAEKAKLISSAKIRYVGTWNRQTFHRPNCKWLEDVPPNTLRHFSSHEEAVKAGYKPCKTCCS